RFHPRFGEVVQIRRRLERWGIEFVVVLQPDGSFATLPAWMTEPEASRFEIGDEPHFPLHILRSMRAEVDGLWQAKVPEVDLGPVRYLATLLGAADQDVLRWFILVVALLLDPAAVLLLLAATRR